MKNEHTTLTSHGTAKPVLQSVNAQGTLDGLLLSMALQQSFRNDSNDNMEVVYTFPLAWGAVLLGLEATVGGKRMVGQVMARKNARDRYEDAVEKGDAPVMVEATASGVLSASLGSLKPGEEASIELKYAQLLNFEQGRVRVVVPTTIAPRYGDAVRQGSLSPDQAATPGLLSEHRFSLAITLCGSMAHACISCPTHSIAQQRHRDRVTVTLDRRNWLDRDFVLLLEELDGRSFAVAGADDRSGSGHTAVIASYCTELNPRAPIPLRLKILVDCSGSMAGDSIQQARDGLRPLAFQLTAQDQVSLSRFGDRTQRVLNAGPASDQHIRSLIDAIDETAANMGGTALAAALEDTFALRMGPAPFDEEAAVLLVTDGEVWDAQTIVDEARRSSHRIYALGVGSAPAESLLREMAEATGGACEFATPGEDMARAIQRLLAKVRLAVPVHAHLQSSIPPLWCSPLPRRLVSGETVHVFMRFSVSSANSPVLHCGQLGPAVHSELSLTDGNLVSRLVAARQISLTTDPNEVREIAERYQLVTAETNLLLVIERAEADKTDGIPSLHKVSPMLAAGWGGSGSVDQVPNIIRSRQRPAPAHSVNLPSPSVWRTNRICPVSALDDSSTDDLDNIEIPAFLRQPSDLHAVAGSHTETKQPPPDRSVDSNLDIGESIDNYLYLLLSRPSKKQRSRRVINTLDEQVSNWERVAKHPDFKSWLLVENPTTKKRRFELLRDAWSDRDGNTLAIVFRLFLDHAAGNRPNGYGDALKGTEKKVGDLIERDYEVIDLLGIGGFGEVFLVYSHNESVKNFYALKILHAPVIDADGIKRFETEARVLLSLDSNPYLVTARFIEKQGDQISLAMDYVQPDKNGRTTLQHHIKSGPIKLDDQIKWVVECCAGLAAAYKAGIKAHRDIKPANLLIDASRRLRVSDFGLASLGLIPGEIKPSNLIAPRGVRDGSQTIEGTSFGTPAYMSPEQFSDAHSCDVRSDIYSLGITMFEMTSNGSLPFLPRLDPNNPRLNLFAEFARLHISADLPPINSFLFPVIAKCCAKIPAQRFQTIDELQSAVRTLASKFGLAEVRLADSELSVMEQYNRITNQAVAHARFGEHEKAIELFKQAIKIFDLGAASFDMGISLQKLGRYQEAIDAYMSIKTDRNADIECSIAYCQAKLGGWKRAIPHYLAATDLAPEYSIAWENLARGYAQTSQRELAAKAFERLIGLPGAQASHWLAKGENEVELHRLSDAYNSLTTVIRISHKGQEEIADKARSILRLINKEGFFLQVKKKLGPGFNDSRLKLATDAAFEAASNGSVDESRVIQIMRRAEPAITYSQAERIYRDLMKPS